LRFVHRLRHGWEAFAEKAGLRFLPPVAAAIVVLAAGILLPFVPRVDALPPQLAPSLAASRISRFLRADPDIPDVGPTGPTYAARPAFFWPECPGAESYSFRLYRADGTEQAAADGIRRTFHIIPPPGRLDPGEYRFEVVAVAKGTKTPWQQGAFRVLPAPEAIRKLSDTVGVDLGAAENAYVLLGCYADLRSPSDVVSAFLQWKSALGEADAIGNGPASVWLKTLQGS
jgi:hypothetical protein